MEDGNLVYDSREYCNAIIETATDELIVGCRNTVIPSTVKGIGRCAFLENSITDITIPASVSYISSNAFYHCYNLFSIIFEGDSLINIGDYAFAYCNSLEEITIPARYIGDYAFIHCGLEKVTLSEHVKYIFSNAFSGCGLKKVSCNGVTPPDIINYCTIHTPFDYYWHVADDQQKVSPLNCRLYVPSEAIGAYEKALGWGQGYTSKDELYDDGLRKYYFQIIKSKEFEDEEIEEKPSDVSVPLTDKLSFSVYGDDRCIVIDCMDGDAVFEVYGIGGSRIYEGTDRRIAVPQPGLYIVRSDGKTRKVIVQ